MTQDSTGSGKWRVEPWWFKLIIRRNIDECHNYIMDNIDDDGVDHGIDFLCFRGIINNNQDVLYQAFNNQFVISDFPTFLSDIRQMYVNASDIHEGDFTDYTEYLRGSQIQKD